MTLLERLYKEYDVEKDPTGSVGHKIANLVYLSILAEKDFERNKLKTPPRKENVQKRYEEFYNLWANSRINENSFGNDSEAKRKALLIFPKFRKTGVQNIESYNDLQVGKIYKNMLDCSMERIDKI